MTQALIIRKETPADVDAIDRITRDAFLYAEHTDHTEQFIVKALRDAGALSVSLVAELEGAIIGHVAASPVSISDGTPRWYGLGPVSVAPGHQQQGVGSQLIGQLLDDLRQLGAAGCVVLGEPRYYGRFGFRADAALTLPGVPAEYFQTLHLAGPLPTGNVTYHRAFEANS
ncbi:GNAT family N-acetyltransferase [Janthinobacterium sp. SUN137]|uniref:GNAT family N-acetyltransferase n=1 Tax=Janthinobacterium sp. SUN137 TaxID=3014789 RepID=UPI002713EC77|nr:N-acetyltransferase [Janthinobacterium sp. SUN137]MDO8039855.1 N-acetyltransferase [Janthinobacterium sp. SUN137]